MKIPLQYQRSEYDCGPTTVLNAVSYLFHRSQIPPEALKYIMLYSLDGYNGKGEQGKSGTSHMAMQFLSTWLNQFGRAKRFAIETEYLEGHSVAATPDSRIVSALQQGGAVVARVMYGCWHYVLLTGYEGEHITLWDPYYRVRPFAIPGASIELLQNYPTSKNRRIATSLLNATGKTPYALGPYETREAVLFFNKETRKTPEKTIEYFI